MKGVYTTYRQGKLNYKPLKEVRLNQNEMYIIMPLSEFMVLKKVSGLEEEILGGEYK